MTEFRCELLSADQLAALAAGPLPSGLPATDAVRSLHRDAYLDTPDHSLRRRGVVCRLRTDADGRGSLSLRIAQADGNRAVRIDAPVRAASPSGALQNDNDVVRRLRGIVDPALVQVAVELEVERLTRRGAGSWLRGPKLHVHLDRVTARRNGTSASFYQFCAHQRRGTGDELAALERALEEQHGVRRSSVAPHERAELALKWARLEDVPRDTGYSDRVHHAPLGLSGVAVPEFLNAELSLLAFQHRVLALAADDRTPLRERLRFLSIVAANVDEFFMVRMAALMSAARESDSDDSGDGLTPAEELAAVREAVHGITTRQTAVVRQCLASLEGRGVRVIPWAMLTPEQREPLRDRFRDEIQPLLTPFAMTLSPGHPLPRLGHLSLSMALVLRQNGGGPPRFAELALPHDALRFYGVQQDGETLLVSLEEVVRGNLHALNPDAQIEEAHVFRVTRSAELALEEAGADDLLDEVARASAARGQGCAVRLEVERGMPAMLRALLLEDTRREQIASGGPVLSDVDEIDGLVDLRALGAIDMPGEGVAYPRIEVRRPFGAGCAFDAIAHGDVLAHHPFDSFADTVTRFVVEAANDAAVAAIKMTLYRIGTPSRIADALLAAARAGKAVTVFVELKARFDEDVNVAWARALEQAGGHVVRGIVGYKTHAKVALVVRREGSALARYVHIGTGNYNTRSGEQYTDLSLFTADPAIAGDVSDLFNELTGMSQPPRRLTRELLVAPSHLLASVLAMIEREASHARAGKPARITIKINGLSDPDVVRALYHASQAGVDVDLIVRGICTLRPSVPGRSGRIRVMSVVGRFLEHSRIYRFENAGDPRYYIGSADLRPRNLRRRVELLAPVKAAAHRARLDELLRLYVEDGSAWDLTADGEYVQRRGESSAQQHLSRGS